MDDMNGKLKEILSYMAVLRKIRADMPLQQAYMLLLIAMEEGITFPDLAEVLETTTQAISRNAQMLSCYGNTKGEPKGLGLIKVTPSLQQRRRYSCFLTERGHRVVKELLAVNK